MISNMKAKDIYQAIKAKHAAVTLKDIRNELQKPRDQTNKGYLVIQAIIPGLITDERWLFNDCYDDANHLERVVFFNKELVQLLTLFPSVLILDATYKTNRFNLPLINI
jgi:SWIM-type zinc finger protein